jgi:hypothetical protein
MQITLFAIRFTEGNWKEYEHVCSEKEVESVVDSANAKARERVRHWMPQDADYLAGASAVFNAARGPEESSVEGDMLVYSVEVDDQVVGRLPAVNTCWREHR